jgi:L-ascorbate metabolism protein UlaG (beta-lactamase superfamily)
MFIAEEESFPRIESLRSETNNLPCGGQRLTPAARKVAPTDGMLISCASLRTIIFSGEEAAFMKILNLDLQRIAHDTFRIAGSKVIYIDPFKVKDKDKADVVLLSHDHFDHLSREDLEKVCTSETHIVASPLCQEGLKGLKVKEITFLAPGNKAKIGGIEIEAVPAYNTNKFSAPGQAFHPKEKPGVGFIIQMDGTRVYHTGDSDFIPEMKSIQCDIALLPVSGTYVMTAEEAAEAASAIKPRIAIPMHYGAIVGSEADAQKFKSLAKNCQVEIV